MNTAYALLAVVAGILLAFAVIGYVLIRYDKRVNDAERGRP